MAKVKKESAKSKGLPFGKKNLYLLAIGLILIIIGNFSMAEPPVNGFWSLSFAPVILVIAYLIIIPYSIFHGRHKD